MFSYQRKLFQHLEQVCRSDLIDGRKHGQEVSFVQAQVIEEVHGGHPPASLKLAMFSLLPYLEESKTWFSRSLFQTENPKFKVHFILDYLPVSVPLFHIALLLCSTLSTCASMKNSKSPIYDCKNGQATTVVRMAAQHTRELIVGRLVWKSSYTRLSETYVHSS